MHSKSECYTAVRHRISCECTENGEKKYYLLHLCYLNLVYKCFIYAF